MKGEQPLEQVGSLTTVGEAPLTDLCEHSLCVLRAGACALPPCACAGQTAVDGATAGDPILEPVSLPAS